MLKLEVIEGPDVLGPNKYRVNNYMPLDPMESRVITDWYLSARNVWLNGEVTYVKRVSSKNADGTYTIVVKPPAVKKLQCKDIPTKPILQFLYKLHSESTDVMIYATHSNRCSIPSVNEVMPMVDASNWKLAPAKMTNLIARGLVNGSRRFDSPGEYAITQKGIRFLSTE